LILAILITDVAILLGVAIVCQTWRDIRHDDRLARLHIAETTHNR